MRKHMLCNAVACGLLVALSAHADTVLETETAELGAQGQWLVSNSFQLERAPDERHNFTLFQYEYALTDRAEILLEPFFQEWIYPKNGESFHGAGDLEITPSYLVLTETDDRPAVALALKVKVPTASDAIGTGKTDYYPYVILGKHFGDWIANANLGVDFIGKVSGENLRNQGIADFSLQRVINDQWSVYGEVFGNTKVSDGEKGTVAAAVATEYQVNNFFNVFVSLGYDSDDVASIRPGFNIHF